MSSKLIMRATRTACVAGAAVAADAAWLTASNNFAHSVHAQIAAAVGTLTFILFLTALGSIRRHYKKGRRTCTG